MTHEFDDISGLDDGELNEAPPAAYRDEVQLETLLSEFPDAHRIFVKRLEPAWAAGDIGEIDIDPGMPLSKAMVRDRFGGRRLRLMVRNNKGHTLKMLYANFPVPPRRDGLEISPEDIDPALAKSPVQPAPVPPSQSQPGADTDMLKFMFGALQETQKAMTEMSANFQKQIIELSKPKDVPEKTNSSPQTQNMKQTLKDLVELQDLQKQLKGDTEEKENGGLEGIVDSFMKMEIKKQEMKMKAEQAKIENRTAAPPLEARTPFQQVAQQPLQGQPTLAKPAHTLTNSELAAMVKLRMEGMTEDERAAALNQFLEEDGYEEEDEEDHDSDRGTSSCGDTINNQALANSEDMVESIVNKSSGRSVSLSEEDEAILAAAAENESC